MLRIYTNLMNSELSTYAVAILDHIKRSERVVGGYGKISSLKEMEIAFGIKKQSEDFELLKSALEELKEKKLILEVQRGAFSITPLGNTYQPKQSDVRTESAYVPDAMEMEILEHFYERTGIGHTRNTLAGLGREIYQKHKDWNPGKIDEAIRVLIYQKFLDKNDVKTKTPMGMRRIGEKTEYRTVTTHYVLLSGKAIMLLSKRDQSNHPALASIHVADTPYSNRRMIEDLFASATSSLKIVDAYIGRKTLDYLLSAKVAVRVITSDQKEKNFDEALNDFRLEYEPGVEIRRSSALHGRFIIIDESRFYLIDHSIKNFGDKPSSIIEISEPLVQKVYRQLFDDNWGLSESKSKI